MKRSTKQDVFNLLIKYEKWVVGLLGINFLCRCFLIGEFYYEMIPELEIIRFGFIFIIAQFLFKLIDITKQNLNQSWCKKTGWWNLGAIIFQYLVAPIWMHLIAHNFNGKEEQKSTLLGYAITCDVLVGLIYAHLLITLERII